MTWLWSALIVVGLGMIAVALWPSLRKSRGGSAVDAGAAGTERPGTAPGGPGAGEQ